MLPASASTRYTGGLSEFVKTVTWQRAKEGARPAVAKATARICDTKASKDMPARQRAPHDAGSRQKSLASDLAPTLPPLPVGGIKV